jgi:hypothetical protein
MRNHGEGLPTPEQMGVTVRLHPEALRMIDKNDLNGLRDHFRLRKESIEDVLDFDKMEV